MKMDLHPMDIVVHEGKLWVVNSAHYMADDGEPAPANGVWMTWEKYTHFLMCENKCDD